METKKSAICSVFVAMWREAETLLNMFGESAACHPRVGRASRLSSPRRPGTLRYGTCHPRESGDLHRVSHPGEGRNPLACHPGEGRDPV